MRGGAFGAEEDDDDGELFEGSDESKGEDEDEDIEEGCSAEARMQIFLTAETRLPQPPH